MVNSDKDGILLLNSLLSFYLMSNETNSFDLINDFDDFKAALSINSQQKNEFLSNCFF